MDIYSGIIIILLVILILFAVKKLVKNKREGKTCCGCGCGSCCDKKLNS